MKTTLRASTSMAGRGCVNLLPNISSVITPKAHTQLWLTVCYGSRSPISNFVARIFISRLK
jgi:hypothetical protein